MSAILSFLGGSVFRMVFGEISAWLTSRQQQFHEMERMRFQASVEADQHARNLEAIRVQHELGVQVIRVQGEAKVSELELEGWSKAVANATAPTGIMAVDLWNGIIRPLAASIALFLWVVALNAQGFKMTEWDRELVGVILGFWFASRVMSQAGK